MKNPSQHSQETIERMKANSEAAKRRLARLNDEYRTRRHALKPSRSKAAPREKPSGKPLRESLEKSKAPFDVNACGLLRHLLRSLRLLGDYRDPSQQLNILSLLTTPKVPVRRKGAPWLRRRPFAPLRRLRVSWSV